MKPPEEWGPKEIGSIWAAVLLGSFLLLAAFVFVVWKVVS